MFTTRHISRSPLPAAMAPRIERAPLVRPGYPVTRSPMGHFERQWAARRQELLVAHREAKRALQPVAAPVDLPLTGAELERNQVPLWPTLVGLALGVLLLAAWVLAKSHIA